MPQQVSHQSPPLLVSHVRSNDNGEMDASSLFLSLLQEIVPYRPGGSTLCSFFGRDLQRSVSIMPPSLFDPDTLMQATELQVLQSEYQRALQEPPWDG